MTTDVQFTAKEVATHSKGDDVWMVIHNNVYDVTKYIEEHPGGAEVLLEAAGTDASEPFDNAGHSEDAFDIMAAYKIGTLKGGHKKPASSVVRIIDQTPKTPKKEPWSSGASTLLKWAFVAAGVAATSFAARPYLPAVPMPSWKPFGRGIGFSEGLLIGSSIFVLIDVILAQKLLGLIRPSKSFSAYPPRLKLPKKVEPNLLLKRGWLDPVNYYPLPLTSKVQLSPNVYKLSFSLPTPQTVLGLPTGQHVAIKADINGETVTRSYTPISNNSDKGRLDLVIKVYPDGKLTNYYLATLEVGDEVMFRGPKGAMRYSPGLCKSISMLAGGTGITPMFQLIRAICESDTDTTEISLIYANRTEEDILLREQLDTYARRYPKNLKVYYVLDKPPAQWEGGAGFVTRDMMAERFHAPGPASKVMICGPPGMVNAAKKGLVELGYEKPGAMSKSSDQIFIF